MDEKKLDGQRKMDKIEQETREMIRKYEEDIEVMKEEHRNELERRAQDQAEKR